MTKPFMSEYHFFLSTHKRHLHHVIDYQSAVQRCRINSNKIQKRNKKIKQTEYMKSTTDYKRVE